MKNKIKLEKGQSLLEILIAIGVFFIGIVSVSLMYMNVSIGSMGNLNNTKALFLAEEGIEAVRSIRDNNYFDLIKLLDEREEVDLFLQIENEKWTLTEEVEEEIDGFKRTITLTKVELVDEETVLGNLVEVRSKLEWTDPIIGGREVELVERLSKLGY